MEGRPKHDFVPVNLGKPSLKARLEAYYKLISPGTLSDSRQWREKFDQIYQKYGGSLQGEIRLSRKLEKKYGGSVRLLLTQSSVGKPQNWAKFPHPKERREEEWYELTSQESGTGDIDFLSERFDPTACLSRVAQEDVTLANNWVSSCNLLDNVSNCVRLLPENDPLYQPSALTMQRTTSLANIGRKRRLSQRSHPFDLMAALIESGPLSFLRRYQRRRIHVVIRYYSCIRGSLAGTLIAFDKHMNLLLRNVTETYLPILNGNEGIPKKGEHAASTVLHRRRMMKQIIVRGDNVVSIFDPEK